VKADEVLTLQHGVIRSLLAQLVDTTDRDGGRRRRLLDTLSAELGVHTQIEDEIFYPAIRGVSSLFALAHAEHRQIDDQLAVVLGADPATDYFDEELGSLESVVEHHASEEEREMFPQAQALGDVELEALGQRMQARKNHLEQSRLATTRLRVKREVLRRV